MKDRIVLCTTTKYSSPDDVRARLAMQTVCAASEAGYHIVVVDGGSPGLFVVGMDRAGAGVLIDNTLGMGASRRQAMEMAGAMTPDNGVVVWLEPEKYTLIPYIEQLAEPILSGQADFVCPGRKDMSSYPPEQAHAEIIGAWAFRILTGKDWDTWFGPKVMGKKALQHFLDYRGEYGDMWESIQIPQLRLLKAGLRAESVLVPYQHPAEQTRAEGGNIDFLMRRIDQLQNIIKSLQTEAKKLGL